MFCNTQITEPAACPGFPIDPFDLIAATATELRPVEHLHSFLKYAEKTPFYSVLKLLLRAKNHYKLLFW